MSYPDAMAIDLKPSTIIYNKTDVRTIAVGKQIRQVCLGPELFIIIIGIINLTPCLRCAGELDFNFNAVQK